jgi:hypothetical protein
MERTSRKSEQENKLGALGYALFENYTAYERWRLKSEQREWLERLSNLLDKRYLFRYSNSQEGRGLEGAIDECFQHIRIISLMIEALDS